MAIITGLWRLSIFNSPSESPSIYESILFFLIMIIPIFIGYKSKGNPIIFGFILAITNLTIDQILLNQYNQNLLSNSETRSMVLNMISTGEIHFLPTIENTIFVIFLSIILTFIGTLFSKKSSPQSIEEENKEN